MAAGAFTLKFHAGQVVRKRWRVGPRGGPYWTLAGYRVRAQVRDKVGALAIDRGTDPLVGGVAIAGTASEFIDLTIPTAMTGLTVGGCYSWDLWLTSPDGTLHEPIMSGPVVVLKAVTPGVTA